MRKNFVFEPPREFIKPEVTSKCRIYHPTSFRISFRITDAANKIHDNRLIHSSKGGCLRRIDGKFLLSARMINGNWKNILLVHVVFIVLIRAIYVENNR